MRLTSPVFEGGETIPKRHTADGEDLSVPLSWTAPPDDCAELALIVDDPDAPRPEPWIHWLLYHIPPDVRSLEEGIPREERLEHPAGAVQGKNSWTSGNIGYRGPAPPKGHGPHLYRFTLFALDTEIGVAPGAEIEDLRTAMEDHVVARTRLTGVYER